ncbi:MAG: glycosyltransferase [bacterium]
MKVAHYCSYLLEGETGSANSARGWCEALAREGVEVLCPIGQGERRLPAPEGASIVPVEHRLSGRFQSPVHLERVLGGIDVLVLHGGWVMGNIIAGRASARSGVPFLVTAHGVYNTWVLDRRRRYKSLWNRLFERRHLNRALGVHVFFPEERAGLARMNVASPLVVAPNGVPKLPPATWDGGSGGYLLWLGRYEVQTKGLDLLLQALALTPPPERPPLRLHGPDWRGGKSMVAKLVRDLGLDRWVTVGDPIYGDAKWKVIASAAGYVHPSRRDACPLSVTEAVSAGVPALVGDYPLGRFLASREGAVSAEPSAAGVAVSIERLLSSKGAEVAREGARVVRDHLSWDAVARSWLEQVDRLLETHRAPARG